MDQMTWTELEFASVRLSQAVDLASFNPHGLIDISKDTIRWLNTSLRSLISYLGDVEITAVTAHDIHAWQKHQVQKGSAKAITINSYLRGIKTLYTRLQANGVTGHNPAHPVDFLAESQPSPKAISEENYLAMLNAADNERDKAIVATLWATGCRVGGLLSMDITRMDRWQNDDRDCFALEVVEKFRHRRWVYLKDKEAETLVAWLSVRPPAKCPAVFLSRYKNRLTRNGLGSLWRKLRKNANVSGPTNPHAFRHAFALRKLDEGYDLPTVSRWLGHATPEFTAKIYCIRSERELRDLYFRKA